MSPDQLQWLTMNDEPDKREGKNPKQDPRVDSRQDRLKLALRENLKRRKSQVRARSEAAVAPSERDEASPHGASGKAE
jgi:hypothetical protein